MVTNAWQLEGDSSNPANMPFAGTAMKIQHVSAREAYRQDHHRNLFGTDKNTPFSKQASQGQWSTSMKSAHQGQGNQVDYTGVKNSDDELVLKVREMLARRGARGMIGLQRIFKIMDDNNSGTLDIQEFWKAINDFRVKISQDEARKLFSMFDENDDGELSIDEFLIAIRGQLNDFRKALIRKAFDKIDIDKSGTLEYSDVKDVYSAKSHPDVRAGKKTEEEVVQDFLETFEVHRGLSRGDAASKKGDGRVSFNEFCDYYSNVSASIDDDEYFKLMITNAWNLNNKSYGKA
jgi:Ca2+-binding EF-hand superfamily protein